MPNTHTTPQICASGSSLGLQLWHALPKSGEDVDPSFHSLTAVPLLSPSSVASANLLIREFNNVILDSPLDPETGQQLFVSVELSRKGDSFPFS
jgi:hypothetical protein